MIKDTQLSWYDADLYQQDLDLINFIELNNITGVNYFDNYERIESLINKTNNTDYQLCVYIVNYSFEFSEIVRNCNTILEQFKFKGYLYLSLNKFLAIHESLAVVEENYDHAILHYITNNIPYKLLKYHSGFEDFGIKFNWAHPLTRFYFSNESFR